LYVVTVSDGALKKIVSTPGPDTNPRWSPDGKKIAFETAAGGKYYFYTNVKIAVVAAEGGTPEILTEAFDEDPGLIGWGPDGIYFAAEQKTFAHLFRLNPATKAVEKLSAPDRMASRFFFAFAGLQAGGLPGGARKSIWRGVFVQCRAVAGQEVDGHGRSAKGICIGAP